MAAAVAVSGAILLPGPVATAQSASSSAAANPDRTPYALSGSGFGTRVNGGEVPVDSRTTAYQAMGCSNVAGRQSNNHVLQATIPGLGTATEANTDIWTAREGDTIGSHARNAIERVVIGDETNGTLEINAISTEVHALHTADGYVAETTSHVGRIVYTDAAGVQQTFEAPTPGEPVTIPGFGELIVGRHYERTDASGAVATADALVFRRAFTGTKVKIAHAAAEIADDVKHGLFNGQSAAIRSTALDGNLSMGPQPLSLMPCQGTEGELLMKVLAEVNLGDEVIARGLGSRVIADQKQNVAEGYTRARVASVEIGGGEILAEGIIGRANVARIGNDLKRSIEGTTIGLLVINGEEAEFPDTDVIEVPGVAKLERNLVEKTKHGIAVTALRITLLDGSGAVINLGEARMLVRPAWL